MFTPPTTSLTSSSTVTPPTTTLTSSSTALPQPTSVQFQVQKLADSLVEHISSPGGCNINSEHMDSSALSQNLGALWIRGAFHDIGKYEIGHPVAGLLPSFLNETENMGIGNSIATKFAPRKIFNFSRSDVIALAGLVTVSHCGGPLLSFQPGRIDAPLSTPFSSFAALPDDFLDSYDVIKSKLRRIGFGNEDIVALVTGSHSMGGNLFFLLK